MDSLTIVSTIHLTLMRSTHTTPNMTAHRIRRKIVWE